MIVRFCISLVPKLHSAYDQLNHAATLARFLIEGTFQITDTIHPKIGLTQT